MQSLLVTGGAGFIGSRFVRLAAARGARTVVVDRLTYAGSLRNLDGLLDDGRVVFVRADIADRNRMRALFAEHHPEAVLNFAAESHVDRSIDDPSDFVRTNVAGAFELLEASREYLDDAARSAWPGRFRFIQISTDEVFGSLAPAADPFNEASPYRPNSPYAASKAAADHLARAWHETYGLAAIVTNCSNNFGPNQHPEKLIPLMLLNAAEGRDLPIYGDGGNVRDWLYVDDHCEALWAVLERGVPGATYAIGAGNEQRNSDLVDRVCEALDRERPAAKNPAMQARGLQSYKELKTLVADRRGHDRRYAIDATRIREELGWKPRHAFDQALAETIRWYLANAGWCAAVEEAGGGRERLGLARRREAQLGDAR
jgi:dTDP-glucose 4,6-dehydratase